MDKTAKSQQNNLRGRVTRKMLWDALFLLIEEKHFDQISVKDICQRSEVNRSTFYNHFDSKFDLLEYGIEHIMPVDAHLIEASRARIQDGNPNASPHEQLFKYVYAHQRFFRNIFVAKGTSDYIFKSMVAGTAEFLGAGSHMSDDGMPLEIKAQMYFGAISTLTTWWLKNNCEVPVEDLIRYVDMTIKY